MCKMKKFDKMKAKKKPHSFCTKNVRGIFVVACSVQHWHPSCASSGSGRLDSACSFFATCFFLPIALSLSRGTLFEGLFT